MEISRVEDWCRCEVLKNGATYHSPDRIHLGNKYCMCCTCGKNIEAGAAKLKVIIDLMGKATSERLVKNMENARRYGNN